MDTSKPIFVTAMLVTRNEAKYIKKCLRSFLDQDYPKNQYEILIIDGLSDDGTMDIAKETVNEYYAETQKHEPVVLYFINEKRLLAPGWNIGIKNAHGNYVTRMDAHGFVESDFITQSVRVMDEVKDAVCVGGIVTSKTISSSGEAISAVLSSPFGVGNSKFRVATKAGYADTAAFGLYKKEIFEQIGYFDESLERNQDNNMHGRIRATGGKFYLDPRIKCIYYTRDTIKGMMKQGFLNGKWNVIVFLQNRRSLAVRHMIPFCFVMGILTCTVLGIISPLFWKILLSVMILYFTLGVIYAGKTGKCLRIIASMPFLFLFLHLSYGTGTVSGIIDRNIRRRI